MMGVGTEAVIHPTSVVDSEAELATGCEVGPYSIIQGPVKIGEGTKIGAHVVIEGSTEIGKHCLIFTGAVIGSVTQDKKYKGGRSYLFIGDGNRIREYVTINPGTEDGSETRIGNENLIMAYAHIAHDCVVGNWTTLANNATLAGHVRVDDRAIIGGLSAVHQFVRIGTLSIVGGCSKVVQDVPPYVLVDGHPAKAFGLNGVGLERASFPQEERALLKKAFKILFRSGLSTKNAIRKIESELRSSLAIRTLIDFIASSERGICK